jgi:queuosine precursor transporter
MIGGFMSHDASSRTREYEFAFLVLAAVFLASLVVCNLIVQKFFLWEPFGLREYFYLSVGILPYPITFLVTDILSECYGKRRANQVVMAGLVASVFVVLVVWAADRIPSIGGVDVDSGSSFPGSEFDHYFHQIFGKTGRAVAASMVAYLVAQLVDIQLFHYWRRLTKGKHLWLRNNGSTMLSQLVDTTLVVTLLFLGTDLQPKIGQMILAGWSFKLIAAAVDTPLFYLAVAWFRRRYPKEIAAHDELLQGCSVAV